MDGTTNFTAIARDSYGRSDTNTVSVNLAASVAFVYDLNGNLRTNGTRVFEYDDENQLVRVMEPGAWKSEFAYDGKLRRRVRQEYGWVSSARVLTNEVRYVYDGNLVIQERNGNNLPTVTYTRGKDLSGTMEGAGGIGGLLARTDHSQASVLSHALYHADGNGNIMALVATNGLLLGRYHYDPYGNLLTVSGQAAQANLYRFSSKEWHPNSGLVYYLYRYYDAGLQRWMNRDPIAEAGGVNLHRYVANRVPNRLDPLGLVASGGGDGECPGTPPGKGGAKCYQYACGNYGRNSDVPGARGGQRCGNAGDCGAVKQAALADGMTEVPADGQCPEGTHIVGYAAGTYGPGGDFHWYRRSKDGKTWCHKFKTKKPSNLDGDGKPIVDPAEAKLRWPATLQDQASSYKHCGYLCSPDSWE